MFLLLVSAAAVLQQAPPALPSITELKTLPSSGCRAQLPVATAETDPPGAKKLAELPPGRQYRAVLRSWRGCDIAEVRKVGPDGQAAWTWEPTGPGQIDQVLPTGRRILRYDSR